MYDKSLAISDTSLLTTTNINIQSYKSILNVLNYRYVWCWNYVNSTEHGTSLIKRWLILQENLRIAKVWGCSLWCGENGARKGQKEGKRDVTDS